MIGLLREMEDDYRIVVIALLSVAAVIITIVVGTVLSDYIESTHRAPVHRTCITTVVRGVSTTVCRDE